MGDRVGGDAVAADHRVGRDERVQDRLLGGLDRAPEQGRDRRVGDHVDGQRSLRVGGLVALHPAGVRRGEREEDVAARVAAPAAHPRDPEARALGETLELVGEQGCVRRDHDDDRAFARAADRFLLVPPRRQLARRDLLTHVHAVDHQTLAVAVVRLDERADGPPVFDEARCGPRPSLEVVADHPGAASHAALRHRASCRRIQGGEEVLGPYVHPVDVVQGAVVGLSDHRETPERRAALAAPDLVGHEGVANHADAVGVRDRDRRRETAGLADPLQPGHLTVAVQRVGAGEHRLGADARVRDDRRDAGADRTLPDLKRPVPFDQRRDPDGHTTDVGDRVQWTRWQEADAEAKVAEARHRANPTGGLSRGR